MCDLDYCTRIALNNLENEAKRISEKLNSVSSKIREVEDGLRRMRPSHEFSFPVAGTEGEIYWAKNGCCGRLMLKRHRGTGVATIPLIECRVEERITFVEFLEPFLKAFCSFLQEKGRKIHA